MWSESTRKGSLKALHMTPEVMEVRDPQGLLVQCLARISVSFSLGWQRQQSLSDRESPAVKSPISPSTAQVSRAHLLHPPQLRSDTVGLLVSTAHQHYGYKMFSCGPGVEAPARKALLRGDRVLESSEGYPETNQFFILPKATSHLNSA